MKLALYILAIVDTIPLLIKYNCHYTAARHVTRRKHLTLMRCNRILKNGMKPLHTVNIIPTMPQNTNNTLHIIRGNILMKIIGDILFHHIGHLIKSVVMEIHCN